MNVNSSSNRGEAILAALKTQFPGAVLDEERQTPEQVTITVKINLLPDVVQYLYYQHDGWLPVLFGNDERTLNGHYAVYYALSMEGAEKCWIVVKALVDADSREFPSVTPRVPAAVWGEREIRDMYGLIPVGLPDQRRLVLPDDWPEDMHPLRKDAMDYRLRPEPTTDSETYPFINEGNSDARVIPVGRCISPPMNRVTSACLWMASKLSMLITACFMSIAAWRNWQKRGWATTK